MIPTWLHDISIAYLALGGLCAVVIAIDIAQHPQHMWIMNVVWPVTALFGTVWVAWQYATYGRLATDARMRAAMRYHQDPPSRRTPFAVMVGNGALHCGSGCTLGDIAAEWLIFLVPAVAVAFGYGGLFGRHQMFAAWIVDYIFAYIFGIVFQYFSIAPMRGLSFWDGMIAAIKADTLSLTAWQLGMYGFMAAAYFGIFGGWLGVYLSTGSVEFWFMMQIAMICGFLTAFPVNWWLIRAGIKEEM